MEPTKPERPSNANDPDLIIVGMDDCQREMPELASKWHKNEMDAFERLAFETALTCAHQTVGYVLDPQQIKEPVMPQLMADVHAMQPMMILAVYRRLLALRPSCDLSQDDLPEHDGVSFRRTWLQVRGIRAWCAGLEQAVRQRIGVLLHPSPVWRTCQVEIHMKMPLPYWRMDDSDMNNALDAVAQGIELCIADRAERAGDRTPFN